MRGKLMFLTGAAVGFVLGARAGRERYEQMVDAARRMRDNPSVQEAAGVVQAQASRIYTEGKGMMSGKLGKRSGPEEEQLETVPPPAEGDPLADTAQRPAGTTF